MKSVQNNAITTSETDISDYYQTTNLTPLIKNISRPLYYDMFLIHYKKYEYDVYSLDMLASAHVEVSSINTVLSSFSGSMLPNLGVWTCQSCRQISARGHKMT